MSLLFLLGELWVIIIFRGSLFPCHWIKMWPRCTSNPDQYSEIILTNVQMFEILDLWQKALWVGRMCAAHISAANESFSPGPAILPPMFSLWLTSRQQSTTVKLFPCIILLREHFRVSIIFGKPSQLRNAMTGLGDTHFLIIKELVLNWSGERGRRTYASWTRHCSE